MTGPLFFYDNVLEGATVSSTAAGYDAINLEDWRQYTFWKPTALPATITKDHGSDKQCDYLLLTGGDFAGCSIQWQASTDNFVSSTVTLATITGETGSNAFAHILSPVTYRYWRVVINGTTPPAVSIAAIGLALEMPYGAGDGYDPVGRTEEGARNVNDNGYPVGIVATHEMFQRDLSFPMCSWEFLRDEWLPAWQTLKSRPFSYAWNVEAYPDEIDLVMCDGRFTAPHNAGELTTIGIKVSGVPDEITGLIVDDNDPYWYETVLAMHMDGADNGTVFTDEKGKTITRGGNTVTKTSVKKFGTASAFFDGTGDYLYTPYDLNSAVNGDFTAELWVNPTALTSVYGIFFCGSTASNANRVQCVMQIGGTVTFYIEDGATQSNNCTTTATLTAGAWNRIIVQMTSGVMQVTINEEPFTELTKTFTASSSANLYLGLARQGGVINYFNGYIDDVRMTTVSRHAYVPELDTETFPNF